MHQSRNDESTHSILEKNLAVKTPRADSYLGPRDEYSGILVHERGKILRLAADLLPKVAEKLGPFPVLDAYGKANSSRAPFSCLLATASLHSHEGFDFDPVIDFTTAILLAFGFDDIIEGVDGEDRTDQLDECYATIAHIVADPAEYRRRHSSDVTHSPYPDQLYAALAHWLSDIPKEVCDEASIQEIGEQLKIGISGMISERNWSRDHAAWPSLDEYLRVGTDSSCTLFLWDVPRVFSQTARDPRSLKTYRKAVNRLGTCIRIYNDIRTYEREADDGEPTTVKILDATGMEQSAVYTELLGLADTHASRMVDVISGFPGDMQGLGESIIQYHDFLRGWYLARDTNHYTADELFGTAAETTSCIKAEVSDGE